MGVTPIKKLSQPGSSLDEARAVLGDCARGLAQYHHLLAREDALQFVLDVEQVSKVVDHLQILAARIADHHGLASDPGSSTTAGPGEAASAVQGPLSDSSSDAGRTSRNCAEFLRETIDISRTEAKRRLSLAAVVLPSLSPSGNPLPPRLEALGEAAGSFAISGRAMAVVAQALERVQSFATREQLENMEHHLTRQAIESDEDVLRVLARRWESVLDQDGQEPTEKVLRARQGVFLKGRRHGLHVLEIGATDEQFEQLATVMNATANPRGSSEQPDRHDQPDDSAASGPWGPAASGTPDDAAADAGGSGVSETAAEAPMQAAGRTSIGASGCTRGTPAASADVTSDAGAGAPTTSAGATSAPRSGAPDPAGPTRAQRLLEGLVSACRIALSTTGLPATGGHRPQVMVTIDYKDLTGATEHAGHAVFAEQITASTIRKLACDADLIPLVLGGSGQVLDVGRAQRLFPPHLRRALVARDKGCAFPDCTIPASWCEAHHLTPWSHGGSTSLDNGVLLCSRHHHLIHQGTWTIETRNGIPWFTPPAHRRRTRNPRRNVYWQAGRAVHHELASATEWIPLQENPPTGWEHESPETARLTWDEEPGLDEQA
ncbi:HNH endonuclease signature motif containing protein [Arthrobacter agilis]|uniref:HNH endonuclease signature motif containing protein n=1 Tax=Arthrobacter agilis TaxID=37921 RepID=UPI00278881F1|nr:HNH endonuclease signature motif containing protein [Arthrobacter agilis]MDQ0735951.1 hypothetical protein [Arthrobacter agilis]